MTMSDEQPFLRKLDADVEADIELDAAGAVPDDDIADWVLDPYEAQVETADLNSLRGAIQALEADDPPYSSAGN
jgi:hypothetical protein